MTANSPVYKFQLDRALVEVRNEIAAAGTGGSSGPHTHPISQITGLQAALDGKQAAGSYAASTHSHDIADVTGLQTALDGKQAAGSYVTTSGLNELVDDRVATLLVAGTNVTLTYNDVSNTLTIAASSGGGNSYFPQGW